MEPLVRHHPRSGWAIKMACGFAIFGIVIAAWVEDIDDTMHRMTLAWQGSQVDATTTASVRRTATEASKRVYTVRRSVLQPPGKSCTIYSDGTSSGSC